MPRKKSAANSPETTFSNGNTSASVFQNSKGSRSWRSLSFQRSYQDSESNDWKRDTVNLSLGDVNNAVRVLMLARQHIDNPPADSKQTPERAFQIGNVSTAVFNRDLDGRTVRDTVFQRDYQDERQQWQRQQIRFYQTELSNAIHTLSLARDHLEQTEADVTEQRQAKK